jgi:RNA polymerase sigma-70 factor (ECF subfamily)
MRVSAEAAVQIYRRLLAGEPDAPSDMIELFLEPLARALRARFPNVPDPNLVTDTVEDTLFNFVQQPARYQPEKGTLWNYLYMDALGDLNNAWKRENKRLAALVPFDPVAHDRAARNDEIEAAVERLAPDPPPGGLTMAQLRQEIPDPRDWAVFELMLEGERRTDVYAQVLGIAGQPVAEQRRLVKQVKDRLRLRLKRRGG